MSLWILRYVFTGSVLSIARVSPFVKICSPNSVREGTTGCVLVQDVEQQIHDDPQCQAERPHHTAIRPTWGCLVLAISAELYVRPMSRLYTTGGTERIDNPIWTVRMGR